MAFTIRGEPMKGIMVVRKYKNRRLYDTERSAHITREELLEAIRSGRDVQVQEAGTGEDVTVETLLQLIQSEKGPQTAAMPTDFLHFLIRSDENVLQRFFREFLPGAMRAFHSTFANLHRQQRDLAGGFFPFNPFGNPWLLPWGGGGQEQPREEEDKASDPVETIRRLEARVKELESELGKKKA
jgi:polyhydroxyalkanoate synthesis repressor PhaR